MKPKLTFDDVLAICLDQAMAQPGGADATLSQYPQWACELRSLVEAASWLNERAVNFDPRAGFVAASRSWVVEQVRKPLAGKTWFEKWFGAWQKQFVLPVGVALALLFFFFTFTAGESMSRTAVSALPGDSLYPVKIFVEDLQLAASLTNEGDARLYVQFAARRVDEIEQLVFEGDVEKIETAVARYEQMVRPAIQLTEAIAAADPEQGAALSAWVETALAEQATGLALIADISPTFAQNDLEQIMAVNASGRETVQKIVVTQETPVPTDKPVASKVVTQHPAVTSKPANTHKPPTHTAKPTDEPKPTKEENLTSTPKPTAEPKPTKEEDLTSTPKPTAEPKPTKEEKPTSTPKPTDEPKPTKEEKPTAEPKPTDEAKPTDEPKPTKEPKP